MECHETFRKFLFGVEASFVEKAFREAVDGLRDQFWHRTGKLDANPEIADFPNHGCTRVGHDFLAQGNDLETKS